MNNSSKNEQVTQEKLTAISQKEPSALLDAALTYAALGWAAFPCHTPTSTCSCSCHKDCDHIGKHPRTKHGLKEATTDETTIRNWWHKWPHANIAIATGEDSNLVVLDVDGHKQGY